MRVAITGAAGFIGKYLVERLLERGDRVIGVVRDGRALAAKFGNKINIREVGYERKALLASFQDMDAVIHLAAKRTALASDKKGFHDYYEGNVRTTENVFLAAAHAGVPRICNASSIAVYSEENCIPYNENQMPIPSSLYGVSKLACENLSYIYSRLFPLSVISLRFGQVYGLGEREGGMFMTFIKKAQHKETLQLWDNGARARDFIYVKDVVSAIAQVLESPLQTGVYNVGANRAISNLEIAHTINTVFQNEGNLKMDPTTLEDNRVSFMDSSKAQNQFGWSARWSLVEGLEDMFLSSAGNLSQ